MSKSLLLTVCCLLLATNALSLYEYVSVSRLLAKTQIEEEARTSDSQKFASFLKLVVAKVLQTGGDVSFEDRLTLENSVRNLNDPEILSTWKSFVDSKDGDTAQKHLKDLLRLLVDKINP